MDESAINSHGERQCYLKAQADAYDLWHWNTLWISLFFIGIGIFLLGTPKTIDDFWFQQSLSGWYESQGMIVPEESTDIRNYGFPFEEIVATWKFRITSDNARLGNILVTPLLVFPKWIGMSAVYISFILSFFLSLRTASVDWRRSLLVSPAIFIWTFIFPWRDGMTSLVFAFNYVMPAGLSVWLCYLILKKRAASNIGVLILAFLVGWWHEAFAGSLICGLIATAILYKGYRNRLTYTALAGLIAGLLLIVLPSSFGHRIGVTVSRDSLFNNLFNCMIINFTYIIFIIMCIWWSFRRKRSVKDPVVIFMLFSGSVSVFLMLLTYTQSRITTWTTCASLIGILILLKDYRTPRSRTANIIKNIATATLLALSLIHLTFVDYYSIKIYNSFFNGVHEYNENPQKQLFGKVYSPDKLPMILLNLPDHLIYNTTCHLIFTSYESSHQHIPEHPFYIIPEELKYTTRESGTPLKGDLNARMYNGRIIVEAENSGITSRYIVQYGIYEIDLGNGYIVKNIALYKFRSEADGREYYYISPYTSWIEKHFKEIKGIRHLRQDPE